MIQKNFKFEIKSVDDDGTFRGYASVTGNLDSDNEVIDKGAFRRTLDHSKGVVPILFSHDRNKPIGWGVSADEDQHGLSVVGKLLIDTEYGKLARSYLVTGLELGGKPGLSIGFTVPKGGDYFKDGQRHFREVALKEWSVCTFQSNPLAVATAAKEDKEDTDYKEEAKTKRVSGEDLPPSAFAYVGDPEKTETWKLPIRFSDDAKTARHIRNALARFGQTQGIPESERAGVLGKIRRAAKEHGIDAGKSRKDFQESLAEAEQMSALYEERCSMDRALYDAVQDALGDDGMSADEKKSEIADSYSQYSTAMSGWYARFIDADEDNDPEEDLEEMDGKQAKAGRSISESSAQKIKLAMSHIMEASAMHQKALGVLTDLSSRPYTAHDVNRPDPVGAGAQPGSSTTGLNPVGGGKSKQEEPEGDPDAELHSLLELVRSVADHTKAA